MINSINDAICASIEDNKKTIKALKAKVTRLEKANKQLKEQKKLAVEYIKSKGRLKYKPKDLLAILGEKNA